VIFGREQHRMRIRRLCIFTALLVVGQYTLTRLAGQPYPALVMPAFYGDGGYRGGIVDIPRVDVVLVQSDGSRRTFQADDLLVDFDSSYQGALLSKYLSPPRTEPEARISNGLNGYLRRVSLRLLPGLHRGQRQRDAPDNRASLRGWLKRQVARLLPNQEVQRVEFQWFTETVSVVSGRPRASKAPLGVFVVPLDTDAPR
jgi:hypothetical protein